MSGIVSLVILFLVLVLVVFPLWAIFKLLSLSRQNEAIAERLVSMEAQHLQLREKVRAAETAAAAAGASRGAPPPTPAAPPFTPIATPLAHPPAPPPVVPPAPAAPTPAPERTPAPATVRPLPATPVPAMVARSPLPPPLPPPILAATPPPPPAAGIDWEQFMGAKLFAWLGGLAALLGVAFFLKYSFEHGWIPPEVRVAMGFLFAIALVIGGLKLDRTRYAITAQTLIATGIVSLYAVTFACNTVYHFAFFGPVATFLLMTLITAAAFLLAVRLEARVVAVLGILGGFLTPVLLSTGRDNPAGLFGYLALLNLGLAAVALHRRWHSLVGLGAAGTLVMQAGWAMKFLGSGNTTTAMVVCLVFCGLFLGIYGAARRLRRGEPVPVWLTASAMAYPLASFGWAMLLLTAFPQAISSLELLVFIVLADACLLTLAWFEEAVPKLHLVAGAAAFLLLAAWTAKLLHAGVLPLALTFYLVFAILHTAFPLLLERHRPAAGPTWWSQLFPPLTLLLLLGPLFKLDELTLLFWPCVLLVDLLAIGLAVVTGSLVAVAAVLAMTLVATGVWVFDGSAAVARDPLSHLLVIGGFAGLFFAAGIFLARKFGDRLAGGPGEDARRFGDPRAQIPAFSALLPFVLLILMALRLPLANPSPLFGLALLLTILTLGLARLFTLAWLPACALVGVAGLEYAWSHHNFTTEIAGLSVAWYLLFHAVFAAYPFVFRARFTGLTGPWAIAALSGVVQFPLVYHAMRQAWPNAFPGLLPALFALPPLLSLALVLRAPPADARTRLNHLAWFGGVALLFITLIFPIQFDRQWLTVAWALEGAALLWLFQRVPHPGLRATGLGLLVAAFIRLALNPAVLAYHVRGDTPVFNWYLYTYGAVIAALWAGARLLAADSRHAPTGWRHQPAPWLQAFAAVLLFLLLNIEIADYFSVPGSRVLAFEFTGNFARDMTYTIAWALFSLALLLVSIWKQVRLGRHAALALLGVTLLKLFFHDLARLEALYRIGALFAVAVIAIVASFAYQRFLPGGRQREEQLP